MTKPAWKSCGRRATAGLFLLALFSIMLRWFEHHQVYFPSRGMDWTPAEAGWRFEDLRLAAADGVRLHGWFLPAPAPGPRARLAVVHLHGNAGNISHRHDIYSVLREAGVNVLALDYRGYGRSEGRPGEEGTYRDAKAAHGWLTERGFSGSDIIAFGESLGGGVATELALRRPLGGLVLQSTFTSIPDIGAELFPWLPVRWISTIGYDTRSKLPRLQVPVLILHSRQDTLVRFHHAERNFAVAREPKFLRELVGDHNDALATTVGRDRMASALAAFFDFVASRR